MSHGIEPVEIVDWWIYNTLKNDATIAGVVGTRITNGGALGPSQTPYITWDMNSARDITTHEGLTLWAECLVVVKVVGQGGSYGPLLPTAKRIHDLLQGANATTERGHVASRRERVVRYAEVDDNVQIRHLGGIYRIIANTI